jgi:hypothetical protein
VVGLRIRGYILDERTVSLVKVVPMVAGPTAADPGNASVSEVVDTKDVNKGAGKRKVGRPCGEVSLDFFGKIVGEI